MKFIPDPGFPFTGTWDGTARVFIDPASLKVVGYAGDNTLFPDTSAVTFEERHDPGRHRFHRRARPAIRRLHTKPVCHTVSPGGGQTWEKYTSSKSFAARNRPSSSISAAVIGFT